MTDTMSSVDVLFQKWKGVGDRILEKAMNHSTFESAALREQFNAQASDIQARLTALESARREDRAEHASDMKKLLDICTKMAERQTNVKIDAPVTVQPAAIQQAEAPTVINQVSPTPIKVENSIKWPEHKPEIIRVIERDKQGRIEAMRVE